MTKKFFLDQHGCAKNQVDGEILISRLEAAGFVRTEDPAGADLILINSCGFIESAKKESLSAVMDARDAYPDAKILLTGCLAERYASEFDKELPEADGFFGNGDLSKIDGVVKELFDGGRPVLCPTQKGVCCGDRTTLLSFKGSAYVKITEGCNNRCSFCAIPIIRGDLRSRNCDEIVSEIKGLVETGTHEINLIGQDLAAYGCGKDDDVFADGTNGYDAIYKNQTKPRIDVETADDGKDSFLLRLMKKISVLPGDFWVRLLYIHPDHFNPDILSFMKTDKRFLPYFDIPFQSGDDAVIHAMNRKGNYESYVRLVRTIRDAFPESCIRTTFLTGFPGETAEAARNTQNFLHEIESDWSGCFPFSCEEGTAAEKMKGRVNHKTAEARASELEAIQAEITQNRLKARVGKIYDVLVEELVENKEGTDEGFAIGRAWFEAPDVDGNVVIQYDLDDPDAVRQIVPGAMVKVRSVASSEVDIDGEWVGNELS